MAGMTFQLLSSIATNNRECLEALSSIEMYEIEQGEMHKSIEKAYSEEDEHNYLLLYKEHLQPQLRYDEQN